MNIRPEAEAQVEMVGGSAPSSHWQWRWCESHSRRGLLVCSTPGAFVPLQQNNGCNLPGSAGSVGVDSLELDHCPGFRVLRVSRQLCVAVRELLMILYGPLHIFSCQCWLSSPFA
jgi:hypothetical protein